MIELSTPIKIIFSKIVKEDIRSPQLEFPIQRILLIFPPSYPAILIIEAWEIAVKHPKINIIPVQIYSPVILGKDKAITGKTTNITATPIKHHPILYKIVNF